MRLKSVELQNFMSIESCALQLQKGVPLVLSGDNGIGKSSILSGIRWCLTSDTGLGLRADSVRRRGSRGGTMVRTEYEDEEGNVYTFQRYRKHPEHKSRFYVLFNGEGYEEGSTAPQKLQDVLAILGASSKGVLQLMSFQQGAGGLLSWDPSRLVQLLVQVLGGDLLDKMDQAREERKNILSDRARMIRPALEELESALARTSTPLSLRAEREGVWKACGRMARLLDALREGERVRVEGTSQLEQTGILEEMRRVREAILLVGNRQAQKRDLLGRDRCTLCGQDLKRTSYVAHVRKHLALDEEERQRLEAESNSLRRERGVLEGRAAERFRLLRSRYSWPDFSEDLRKEGWIQRELSREAAKNQHTPERGQGQVETWRKELDEINKELAALSYWRAWIQEHRNKIQSARFHTVRSHLRTLLGMFFSSEGVDIRLGLRRNQDGSVNTKKVQVRAFYEGEEVEVGSLSGGQLRRANVAFQIALLALTPLRTVLFDEWFADLDDAGLDAVWGALSSLSETHAVMVVTRKEQGSLVPTHRAILNNGVLQIVEL